MSEEDRPSEHAETAGMGLPAVVITCSDSAAAGLATDTSGPLAGRLLAALGHHVEGPMIVPDDTARIAAAVRAAIDAGARIVVTTGGTGAGPRDVTPEALRGLGLRELPGLGEAMRAAARARVPAADLSRGLGGIVAGAVVLALPGSPGGVRDGIAAVGGLLEHAVSMATGGGHSQNHRQPHPGQQARSGRNAPSDRHQPAPQPAAMPRAMDSGQIPSGSQDTPGGDSVGGTDGGLVRNAPIAARELAAEVTSPHAGAVVTFVGVVRDHDHDRAVTALHYEGHPEASRVLSEVVADARQRPGVFGAAARHRVGRLAVGDVAFVAAVSAAHRGDAFAACAWLVDEAKSRLPIWKHQYFADGTDEWVNCP